MLYTSYMSDITPASIRQPIIVRLDNAERAKLEALAAAWGLSLAGAMRRLIREKKVPQ